jgi:hypothetical protein
LCLFPCELKSQIIRVHHRIVCHKSIAVFPSLLFYRIP